MAVTAPVPGLSAVALPPWEAALPLPEIGAATGTTVGAPIGTTVGAPIGTTAGAVTGADGTLPDLVVFSSAPLRLLSDLAASGLRQLIALLPTIERAVQEASPLSLGHLARAVGAAARQIGDGHAALLAEGPDRVAAAVPRESGMAALRTVARQLGAATPDVKSDTETPSETGRAGAAPDDARQILRAVARQLGTAADAPLLRPDPAAADRADSAVEHWLGDADHALRDASNVLDRAEEQLRPLVAHAADEQPVLAGQHPTSVWAMTEVIAAQAQVAAAFGGLATFRLRPAPWAAPAGSAVGGLRLDHLAGAITLFGIALLLAIVWLLGGIWSAAVGVGGTIVALAVAALWGWRIVVSAHGLRLDLRR